MLHYETISGNMRALSKVIFENFDSDFYLAGGTALALHIGHRTSVDLDYFIQKEFDTQKLKQQLFEQFDSRAVEVIYEEKNTLWCTIDGIKVSFITRKDALLKPVEVNDSSRLVSLEDIIVMKLAAICSRDEFKDYFDLACLSKMTDIRSWVPWWQTVYPHVDITGWLVALGSLETVPVVELYIRDDFKQLDVQSTLNFVVHEITDFVRIQG